MISLKKTSEPFDIELPYGVTVIVKPLTTAGMAAAQAAARRRVEGLEGPVQGTDRSRIFCRRSPRPGERWRARRSVPGSADQGTGGPPCDRLDGHRGRSAGDPGKHSRRDVAVSRRRAVLSRVHPQTGAAHRYKKRIRALCRWHFQPGGGPSYCAACPQPGDGETDCGQECPRRKFALITNEEHQAWDVLQACLGQLRLAPSGHVLGVNLGVALKIADARGHDRAVVSELLQAAEAGLVEAMNSKDAD